MGTKDNVVIYRATADGAVVVGNVRWDGKRTVMDSGASKLPVSSGYTWRGVKYRPQSVEFVRTLPKYLNGSYLWAEFA